MQEFESIYNEYYKDIYYFILKMTGYEDELAEELTQESFYQAFVSFHNFRGDCSLKSFICEIAKNTFYKYLRDKRKQENIQEKIAVEENSKSVSDIVEKKVIVNHIREIISGLDERNRSIVEYRLFGELSYKEIGDLLGIREASAKVAFARLKVKIQTRLMEDYGYEI